MFKNNEKLLEIVRKCVNDYDPEQLIGMGCPDDEYKCEIEAIAGSLTPGASVMEVWLIVCNTLHWYFHPHDEPVLYWKKHLELAHSIVEALPNVDQQQAEVSGLGPHPTSQCTETWSVENRSLNHFGNAAQMRGRGLDVKEKIMTEDIVPPVDRSKRCTLSGNPETPEHREIRPDGMQKDYIVLCPQERAKGFVRPVRRTYRHKTCNTTTTMGLSLAETYARDPEFYSGTFCCNCRTHFPLDQFVWEGTNEQVGK